MFDDAYLGDIRNYFHLPEVTLAKVGTSAFSPRNFLSMHVTTFLGL